MGQGLKELTVEGWKKEKDILSGPIILIIVATLEMAILKVLESMCGVMEESMKASGKPTKCTEKASLNEAMVGFMMESTIWTRNKALECLDGLQEWGMKEIGKRESNMEKENLWGQMKRFVKELGWMESSQKIEIRDLSKNIFVYLLIDY